MSRLEDYQPLSASGSGLEAETRITMGAAPSVQRESSTLAEFQRCQQSSFQERMKVRFKRWWYVEAGCSLSFVSAEMVKLILSVATNYGLVSLLTWDKCGFPATPAGSDCDQNYKELRLKEMATVAAMALVVVGLRIMRRKRDLNPNLQAHRRFADVLTQDDSVGDIHRTSQLLLDEIEPGQMELRRGSRGESVEMDAKDAEGTVGIEFALNQLEIQLNSLADRQVQMQQQLNSWQTIQLKDSWYSWFSDKLRQLTAAVFGFNIGMQFILSLSTLSQDDAYQWGEHPIANLGVLGWATVLMTTGVSMLLMPDDMWQQNEDLRQKCLRQYEGLRRTVLQQNQTVRVSLETVEHTLTTLQRHLHHHHRLAAYNERINRAIGLVQLRMRGCAEVADGVGEELTSNAGIISRNQMSRAGR